MPLDLRSLVADCAFLRSIGPTRLHTLLALAAIADDGGRAAVTQAKLARLLGVTQTCISVRLAALADYRWQGAPVIAIGRPGNEIRILAMPAETSGEVVSDAGRDESSSPEESAGVARSPAIRPCKRDAAVNNRRKTTRGRSDPDVRRVLERHRSLYEAKVGAPFPVSWGRDGACMKRILGMYSPDDVMRMQDMYFEQAIDSFAGRQGYSVPEFMREAPALTAQMRARETLADEERALVQTLQAEGVSEVTAVALVREFPGDDIRRQLAAHARRREYYANPAAALVRAIRDRWPVKPDPECYRPLTRLDDIPVSVDNGPPGEAQMRMDEMIASLTGRRKTLHV